MSGRICRSRSVSKWKTCAGNWGNRRRWNWLCQPAISLTPLPRLWLSSAAICCGLPITADACRNCCARYHRHLKRCSATRRMLKSCPKLSAIWRRVRILSPQPSCFGYWRLRSRTAIWSRRHKSSRARKINWPKRLKTGPRQKKLPG